MNMNDESSKTDRFRNLIKDFRAIPRTSSDPTFMEICQMGSDRFEERCSQILRFFLSPSSPHGLRGMFIHSLLEAIGHETLSYSLSSANVITEEMTSDGKFIDITVVTDGFVITIENKIGAELYNPLDSYVRHINETYRHLPEQLFVVLSVRRITDDAEIRKIKANGYIYLNYDRLFATVKRNLGRYAIDANPTYITFLFDFIRTIENRYYNSNMELKRFFYENRDCINELISEFNSFGNSIRQQRNERLSELKVRISDRTSANWWIYQGWDLGTSFNDNGHRIGIESYFENETLDNPLGDFHICITVWKKKDFYPYEADLKAAFPASDIDYEANDGSRIFMHLPEVDGKDSEAILNELETCYYTLKAIADRINTRE